MTNFGLERIEAGNTGPPEKLGLGMLKPCWRTQVTNFVIAVCESWKRRAPPPNPAAPPHSRKAAANFGLAATRRPAAATAAE